MPKELLAEMYGRMSAAVILWEKKLEQPPVARSLPQHCRAEELLRVGSSWASDGDTRACSWLMETRTDTEPLEKEFLTPSETPFMCSYAGDAQKKWEHTAYKQKQGG